MATHTDFLLDICTHPNDDAPRLIYADWLEEQGEGERAEFIRVQCEVAAWGKEPRAYGNWYVDCRNAAGGTDDRCNAPPTRNGFHDCEYHALRRREQALWSDGRDCWGAELPGAIGDATNDLTWWRRGFVERITLSTADFLRHAGAIFRAAPVTAVRLSDRSPYNYSMRSNSSDWAWWYSRHPRENLAPHHRGVPQAIWEQLECDRVVERWKHYRSSEAAYIALSAACILYGRQRANLPALQINPATADIS